MRANLIKEPTRQYKFASAAILVNPQTLVTNRQTYGLLDYLGDIGGLIDALRYLTILICNPYFNYNYYNSLLRQMFRSRSDSSMKNPFNPSHEEAMDQLRNSFKTPPRALSSMSFLTFIFCCRSERRKNHSERLNLVKM